METPSESLHAPHAEMPASADMNADWLSMAPGRRDRGQAASEVERSRAPVDPGGRGSSLETARGRKASGRATAEITRHLFLSGDSFLNSKPNGLIIETMLRRCLKQSYKELENILTGLKCIRTEADTQQCR